MNFLLSLLPHVYAAGEGTEIDFDNPPKTIDTASGVLGALSTIADWMFSIFLLIAVIMILVAAFNLLTSGGSSEKYDSAKKMFMYAVIAVVCATLAKTMVIISARFVGSDITIP